MSRSSRKIRRILVLASIAVIVGAGSATAAISQQPGTVTLGYGATADAATFEPLSRANVKGKIYVGFATDAGVQRADFYLDDPTGAKKPVFSDSASPFLVGTGGIDTTKLQNGVHTLLVQVTTGSKVTELFARFTVQNEGGAAGTSSASPSTTPGSAAPTAKVPVGSKVVFKSDFEPANAAKWRCQSQADSGACPSGDSANLKYVKAPLSRQGPTAAAFTVNDGDRAADGERSEYQSNAAGALVHEGDERWYQWSTKFPENFKNPTGGWFIIMQWHSASGSPPLAINVSNEGMVEVGGDGVKSAKKQPIGPVRKGQWVDYVLHVKFSQNGSVGFVEAWENGKQTVKRYPRATMVDDENYLKVGIYRDDEMTGTSEVWHDGLVITAP